MSWKREDPAQTELGRGTLQIVAAGRLRVIGSVLIQKLFLVLGQVVGSED